MKKIILLFVLLPCIPLISGEKFDSNKSVIFEEKLSQQQKKESRELKKKLTYKAFTNLAPRIEFKKINNLKSTDKKIILDRTCRILNLDIPINSNQNSKQIFKFIGQNLKITSSYDANIIYALIHELEKKSLEKNILQKSDEIKNLKQKIAMLELTLMLESSKNKKVESQLLEFNRYTLFLNSEVKKLSQNNTNNNMQKKVYH